MAVCYQLHPYLSHLLNSLPDPPLARLLARGLRICVGGFLNITIIHFAFIISLFLVLRMVHIHVISSKPL